MLSLPKFLKCHTEREIRRMFREEMIEYLMVNNQTIDNKYNSIIKMLDLLIQKNDKTTLTYEPTKEKIYTVRPGVNP